MKYLFSVLFTLALISCQTSELTEVQEWETQAKNIEIIRDSYGVPHIYGETDADAVFGLLYAQCEDDFNRVEENYIWATGRLAEVEGEEALYSDLRAKLFMTEEEAIEAYNSAPKWLQELCDAFAGGINYYLHTHPEVQPKLLTRFEPWMPMYFSEGSIGGDIERVSTRKIKSFYEKGMPLSSQEVALIQKEKEFEEPAGSNGIAIAGSHTVSGNALLLINPHTSFFFRPEVHVVSKQGLNAYGAVTWGQFFVYQGFNEDTGWMHTSTYTDVMDLYKESIVKKGDSLFYKYDQELRAVQTDTIKLAYTSKEGAQKIKNFPIYRTHHGPITGMEDGKWTATAMLWDPVNALEQSFIRTKQEGYKGFREMMEIRTNSSNNTVYADSEGNIAYFHGNFVPKRDISYDYSQPVDGSTSATDWQGAHEVDETIMLLNPANGWLQNCNSTPFTAALEYSPKEEEYPYYMATAPENHRGVHAIGLLSKMDKIDLDGLIELAYDTYLPAFADMIPGLVTAVESSKNTDQNLREAAQVLKDWDFRTSEESVAMSLARYYGIQIMKEVKRPSGMSFMEFLQYMGNGADDELKVELFTQAIEVLESDFGSWKTPWGEINRYQRIDGATRQAFNDDLPSIPIGWASGRWGALAAYGARYSNNTKKIYGTRGNSFVAVVEFGERLKAKSLLAGGQSGDPKSKHFSDQEQLYRKGEFKEVLFYKEDVLKDAQKTYHPGN
jgi:acyl-homoserine lactone acylase PvdQ